MGLKKFVKRLLHGPIIPNWPIQNGVTFLHHQPAVYNIGDDLCSPRHYFDFESQVDKLCIMGGGAFGDYGIQALRKYQQNSSSTVMWGAGESASKPKKITEIKELPYLAWGIRDADRTAAENFLPCVSCLHPMLDTPAAESGVLLFLNADVNVTSRDGTDQLSAFANEMGWTLLFNNCTQAELSNALNTSQTVITNSYHGAYWGLLTGHAAIVLGYSSKFTSLLASFNLPPEKVIAFDKGNPNSILEKLAQLNLSEDMVKLTTPKAVLSDFRERQINFAEKLIQQNIIRSYQSKF